MKMIAMLRHWIARLFRSGPYGTTQGISASDLQNVWDGLPKYPDTPPPLQRNGVRR